MRSIRIHSGLICTLLLSIASFSANAFDNIVVVGLFKDRVVLRIDGKQKLMHVGETSSEGITLISANSREAVIEYENERRTLTLGSHIGNRYREPVKQRTVTIAPDTDGMYRVNGSINEFQVQFIVDTGATQIAMNQHQAKRMGIDYKMQGEKSQASTAAGIVTVYLVNLKKVRVGEIELQDVQGSVHDGDFPSSILLGNSFLGQVDINREGAIMLLQK